MHTLLTIMNMVDPTLSLLGSLIDKGLTLGVLAVISYNLWKRQQKQDEKLDKYINEDRAEMLEIIKNNTTVLQANTEVIKEFVAEKKGIHL